MAPYLEYFSYFPDFDYGQVVFRRQKVNHNIWNDVSATRHSNVWKYYLHNSDTKQAKCNMCQEILNADHGTNSLIGHLSSKHSITVQKYVPKDSTTVSKNITTHSEIGNDDVQNFQDSNDWCDVSANRSSQAWTYFWYKSETKEAKCKTCEKILKCRHGTHSLNHHLNSKHFIYY